MKSSQTLFVNIFLFVGLLVLRTSPLRAEQIIGISTIDIPDYIQKRTPGLRYERLARTERLHIIDQASVELSLFPALAIDRDKLYREQKARGESYSVPRQTALLDISPSFEKCLFQFSCLGITPIGVQIFREANHTQLYFSPAVSLRFQYIDLNERRWDIKFQTKVNLGINVRDTMSQEASTLSIGMSL